jgi:hypothetical protein
MLISNKNNRMPVGVWFVGQLKKKTILKMYERRECCKLYCRYVYV